MQKFSALLVVSVALVGAASAQTTTKIENPFRAEVGLYIPTYSGGDKNLGVQVGLGYSFLNFKGLDVAAVARGSFWNDFGSDITVQNYGVDVRYRPSEGEKFFVGAGLNAANIDVNVGNGLSGNTTHLGWSVEGGYDFTKSLYGVVRYNDGFGNIDGYKAVTVGVGYRF